MSRAHREHGGQRGQTQTTSQSGEGRASWAAVDSRPCLSPKHASGRRRLHALDGDSRRPSGEGAALARRALLRAVRSSAMRGEAAPAAGSEHTTSEHFLSPWQRAASDGRQRCLRRLRHACLQGTRVRHGGGRAEARRPRPRDRVYVSPPRFPCGLRQRDCQTQSAEVA